MFLDLFTLNKHKRFINKQLEKIMNVPFEMIYKPNPKKDAPLAIKKDLQKDKLKKYIDNVDKTVLKYLKKIDEPLDEKIELYHYFLSNVFEKMYGTFSLSGGDIRKMMKWSWDKYNFAGGRWGLIRDFSELEKL